jgi:hypothetical protein
MLRATLRLAATPMLRESDNQLSLEISPNNLSPSMKLVLFRGFCSFPF